jgi:hypothetical protein
VHSISTGLEIREGFCLFGYVFTLADGAVSGSSKKQATVALSTTEAEYIALVLEAAKESIWI